MKAARSEALTSVKRTFTGHPAIIAVAAVALIGLNALAVVRGFDFPWLFAGVIVADLLALGAGIAAARRQLARAEKRTEASEARLAAIVDSAMDAIITVDAGQQIVLFNRAAEQVFRCPREQALGSALERFLPQRFRAAHRAHVEEFGRTGVTSRRMGDVTTLWALRADGTEFPIEASISQAGDAASRFYTVILRDITLRHELAARVLEAREDEKTRIARELHDELGQLLTALKMDLGWLRERLAAGSDLAARAAEMGGLLDRTVHSTRRISSDLRPLMLDDLGLADAANWLVDDFAKRSGIECRIEIAGDAALDELAKPVATTVYRAIQESLTNIARHAAAKSARVAIAIEDGAIRVEVEDDGRGFAPEDLMKPRSLGLKGMRERIAHLGGSLDISRAPRGGTRLRLRVPLQGTSAAEVA
jgi:PAS domain S-box-containing protein